MKIAAHVEVKENEKNINWVLRESMHVPSKHGILTQCCFNVGPASQTLAQHKASIGAMFLDIRNFF